MSAVAVTALLPLVARARARSEFSELGFADEQAESIVEAMQIPLDMFGSDQAWLRGSILRAKWFDDRCRAFVSANPGCLGVSLGAGLDTRFQRLAERGLHWVDLDLPEVISLKGRFVEVTETYRMLAGDVTDPGWLNEIGWRTGKPLLLIGEGLVMYLGLPDVRCLFQEIAEKFSRGQAPTSILFDYASPLLALNSWLHPALAHTTARFRCGLTNASAIRSFDPRYEILEDYDISRDCGEPVASLSSLYRMMTLGQPFYGLARTQLSSGES